MQVIIKGKNIEVTEALHVHANAKAAKLGRLASAYQELEVKLEVEKNPSIKENQIAELTLKGNGPLMRAVETDFDMYTAIDKAVAKLQRQLKKYHDKRSSRSRPPSESGMLREVPMETEPQPASKIIRRKSLSLKPMSAEEATLQMEMLGHDFFLFKNEDTDRVNLVYRRRDGNFGLIDTAG